MDLVTLLLAEKYTNEKIKNRPGYLESVRDQLKAIQDIMTLERSAPITQIGQIDSLGGSVAPGVVGGVLDMSVKGRTGRNLIENGNFADGTAGWTVVAGTLSINNNTAIVTGNGSNSYAWLMQSPLPLPGGVGKEIFCRIKIKLDNPDCNLIRVYGFDGTNSIIFDERTNPEQNREYTLYGIAPLVSDSKFGIYTFHRYADAATANGKSMKVLEVFTKDLDAENLTGKTADEINEMFPDWFDGTQSVGPKRMKSVGKNLFDGRFRDTSDVVFSSNENYYIMERIDHGGHAADNVMPSIKFKPNTQYSFSATVYEDYDTNNLRVIWLYADGTFSNMFVPTTTPTLAENLSVGGKTVVGIGWTYSEGSGRTYISKDAKIQDAALPPINEPYKQSLAYTPEVGRSLPNGVADVVSINTGIKTKNITDPIILDGSVDETWQLLIGSDAFYVNFLFRSDDLLGVYPNPKIKANPRVINEVLNKKIDPYVDSEGHVDGWAADPVYFGVRILRSRLATEDITGLRAWLASNPITLFYELTDPESSQLDIPPQSLLSFENGTLIQEHIIGEVTFYGSNCPVSDTKYPIEELDFIRKVDQVTGVMTDLDISAAVIAPDGLSFTHPDLVVGDLVDWDYYYSSELSTLSELEYTAPLANVKDIARALGDEGEVF
ncbi:MAG: hypothetical protein MI740_10520 [Halanaerobiales bacterium]|nr:hypothetical protein [Halanaerobiales bacterium]